MHYERREVKNFTEIPNDARRRVWMVSNFGQRSFCCCCLALKNAHNAGTVVAAQTGRKDPYLVWISFFLISQMWWDRTKKSLATSILSSEDGVSKLRVLQCLETAAEGEIAVVWKLVVLCCLGFQYHFPHLLVQSAHKSSIILITVFPWIVSVETILFWKWKMWKNF